MARDYYINGECLVKVLGGAHWSGRINPVTELGLSSDQITITPDFRHRDVMTDDFPEAPPECLWMLGTVDISMMLVHFDRDVLDLCVGEAMAGGGSPGVFLTPAGTFAPAGMPMGGGLPLYASGNYFIGLNLTNVGFLTSPWNFPACYLTGPPVVFPIGVKVSQVQLKWRSVPYASIFNSGNQYVASGDPLRLADGYGELVSSGQTLWNRTLAI